MGLTPRELFFLTVLSHLRSTVSNKTRECQESKEHVFSKAQGYIPQADTERSLGTYLPVQFSFTGLALTAVALGRRGRQLGSSKLFSLPGDCNPDLPFSRANDLIICCPKRLMPCALLRLPLLSLLPPNFSSPLLLISRLSSCPLPGQSH